MRKGQLKTRARAWATTAVRTATKYMCVSVPHSYCKRDGVTGHKQLYNSCCRTIALRGVGPNSLWPQPSNYNVRKLQVHQLSQLFV